MPNDGFPNNHIIRVRDRTVSVNLSELVQNNVATDTFTLDLDEDWDGLAVVVLLGPCTDATELQWSGEPVSIPAALMSEVGAIDVSVVGYDTGGTVRVVTKRASGLLRVVESGCVVGSVPEEDAPDLIGQLVAAGDAANKAAQAANTAATEANGAAGAANTAASAANTAAGKADTAATKATNAATKATDAAGDATRAAQSANAAAEAAGAAAEAARGNVLKGTLGPAPVLSADDAYATKPRRLTVHGATRQNLWVNPSGTVNGVTCTANEDGSMTLSGTSTSNNVWIGYKQIYVLKPGSTYTLSVDVATPSKMVFCVEPRDADGALIPDFYFQVTGSSRAATATIPSNTAFVNCLFYCVAPVGTTVSGTYRVMLNEGSEAQPWCPPGLNGVDDLSVVTAGKNLLKINSDLQTKTANGVTFTPNEDGTVTVNGTATSDVDYYLLGTNWENRVDNYLPVQELVFSSNSAAKLYGFDSSGSTILALIVNGGNQIISAEQIIKVEKFVCYLSYASGHGETNKKVYAQLELGSTAAAYEPPTVTTTPIDLQGYTLNSLPDGTHDELTIDATGAVTLTKRVGDVTFDGSEDERWGYKTYKLGMNNGAPGLESPLKNTNGRCDTLPIIGTLPSPSILAYAGGWVDIRIDDAITDVESGKEWLAANHTTLLYPLATPQTIPLPAVTLPTLPSPNITVYHDSDVPSDITVEYERDVTIAFDKLQSQVSATTVREATNG